METPPQYNLVRDFGLYFRTVRHLKPSQFYYQVVRRFLPSRDFESLTAVAVNRGINSAPWMVVPQPGNLGNEFRFINETRPFDPAAVDWVCADEKKLWRYNLHYFDFLHWDCFSDELKATLIDSWIDSCPMNQWISWDPYAVSLRIVNWIKYFDAFPEGRAIPQRWLDSLLTQASWQVDNMEYQILANHLIKNAKALVFAGVFLNGKQAERFLELGCRVMREQQVEQYMDDGGHYERSHMYHLIVTEDYLDLLNLAETNALPFSADELAAIRKTTRSAMEYYVDLCAADGELQLFNDSTFGITVDTATFLAYARQVLKEPVPEPDGELRVVDKSDTGYYGYRQAGDSLLIDCGAVGPDYQPGHAHCDALSFDLCIKGRRVIVDSGNFTYEHLPVRYQNRRTAAHNTVRVDGEEQSEVWERWRVGRRAYPIFAELTELGHDGLRFVGAHDGYRRLPGKVVHERQVDIEFEGVWRVTDRMQGSGEHRLESYLHLHPDVRVEFENSTIAILTSDAGPLAKVETADGVALEAEPGQWCPEFGLAIDNTVLVMRQSATLPCEMAYTISKL